MAWFTSDEELSSPAHVSSEAGTLRSGHSPTLSLHGPLDGPLCKVTVGTLDAVEGRLSSTLQLRWDMDSTSLQSHNMLALPGNAR